MTPPRFIDEHGRPRATRPCHRCGTPVPVDRTFRLERLAKALGVPVTELLG